MSDQLNRIAIARAHLADDAMHDGSDYGIWLAGRLNGTLDEDEPATDDDMYAVERYLLIEQDAHMGGSSDIYCTGWSTPDEAATYHHTQEYPGDWVIRELVDLDTGEVFTVGRTRVTVEWMGAGEVAP